LTTKFDLYKYQKTGMTKLRVESMARQLGVTLTTDANFSVASQLASSGGGRLNESQSRKDTTAGGSVSTLNLEKLEAQLARQNKRFKAISNQSNQYMNSHKRNSMLGKMAAASGASGSS
jgi:predicted glycoside hydrolase/deacetylase ChbG (UPF0249 family)